jgi:hypothetical protein
MCAPARSQIIEDNASKQTSYGCIFLKKTSVAAINITLGVPGQRADKTVRHMGHAHEKHSDERSCHGRFTQGPEAQLAHA